MDFATGLAITEFALVLSAMIGLYGAFCATERARPFWNVLLLTVSGVLVWALYDDLGPGTIFWVVAAAALVYVVCSTKQSWTLSPLQVFTLGVFISVYLYFLPVCAKNSQLNDPLYYGESLHWALRVFVLDIEFQNIVTALAKEAPAVQDAYQKMGMVLCVLAPVLLFGNLLMLFRDIWSEIHFGLITFRPVYVFSDLNARSIALAEDIFRNPPKTRFPKLRRWVFPPAIVFTEVYAQNQEQDQELLARARAVHAVCLKKDVAQLDFSDKWSRVEIFLIGQKEEENMSQAMTIMETLKQQNKKKVQLYVFSRKESDGCILDSLEYGALEKSLRARKSRQLRLENRGAENLSEEQRQQLELKDRYHFTLHDGKSFSLRRVDAVQHLIWTTVPEMKLLSKAKKNGGELSVLILGFGSYGQEFFKMLTWYCQFEGIRLKLTVVDQQKEPGLRAVIDRQCPELLSYNRMPINGEAKYDIELLSGVDMRDGTFARMISGTDWLATRLQKTDLAFVGMGDDDLNVETALYLRTLTDRVKGFSTTNKTPADQEPVQIYAVVFDEVKSRLLRAEKTTHNTEEETAFFLKNHKEELLHIRFIGGLKEQFCYDRINWQKLEEGAYYHHRSWEEIMDRIHRESGVQTTKALQSPQKIRQTEQEEKLRYHKYEYYRNSSIAKQLYYAGVREELPQLVTCLESGRQTCTCANCVRRKKSEHMRWNAYMRICGWSYGKRNDRAKLHKDLVGWDLLSPEDRLKD